MKKVLLLVGLMGALFGCAKQEVDPISTLGCGKMNLTLNGAASVHTEFNNTLLYENQNGQQGRRLDIRTQTNGGTFILSVNNWEWQNPPAEAVLVKTYESSDEGNNCQEVDGTYYCEGMLGTFLKDGKFYASVTDEAFGKIAITKMDGVAGKITGNFEVKMVCMQDTAKVKETLTFTGTFENLCYDVLR